MVVITIAMKHPQLHPIKIWEIHKQRQVDKTSTEKNSS